LIVYLDASALVKRYVTEAGTPEVGELIAVAALVGSCLVSRVEVAAALAKAVRMKVISSIAGTKALSTFQSEWESLVRLQMTEVLVKRAADLAWQQNLRGYDAAHLAAAHLWQDVMGEPVTVATYDHQLRNAAERTGLMTWPVHGG
jgi:predicted nucleic acid-binding protein